MADSRFGRQFYGLLGQNSLFMSAFNVAQVCLTWFVFEYTKSAVAVGMVAIVEALAVMIVSLPVGTMVDRFNKGSLLTSASMMGFLVFTALIFLNRYFSFNLYIILGLAAIWGSSREISRSTALSTMPDTVEGELLSGANGIFRALGSTLGSISNALAGGLIIAFGVAAGFGFSAVAYLLSGAIAAAFLFPFFRVKSRTASHVDNGRRSMFSDLKEVFRWLAGKKGFFLLTISATFFNFFMDMTFAFFVVYFVEGLNASSLVYGFALSALAIGDVIGSLIPGRINLLRFTGKFNVLFLGGVVGMSILVMGLFPSVLNAILFTFFWGFAIGIGVNLWLTSAHNIVPPGMRGRYFAFDGVLSSISPVAIAVGAFTISLTGIMNDFVIAGALTLVSTLAFSMMKSLWNLDGSKRFEPETP